LGSPSSALSRQIQDLEEELGFKLLDRLPRGVKLSAAATPHPVALTEAGAEGQYHRVDHDRAIHVRG
jgi:Bacterial regulatory helix-turn-helix protein, lysR family